MRTWLPREAPPPSPLQTGEKGYTSTRTMCKLDNRTFVLASGILHLHIHLSDAILTCADRIVILPTYFSKINKQQAIKWIVTPFFFKKKQHKAGYLFFEIAQSG